jgi:hypothetical protein
MRAHSSVKKHRYKIGVSDVVALRSSDRVYVTKIIIIFVVFDLALCGKR